PYCPAFNLHCTYASLSPKLTIALYACVSIASGGCHCTIAVVFGGTVTRSCNLPFIRDQLDLICPTGELNAASTHDRSVAYAATGRRINRRNPGSVGSLFIPATPSIYHAPGYRYELCISEWPGRSFSHISQIDVAPCARICPQLGYSFLDTIA